MIQEKHIESAIKELFADLKFTAEPAGLYDPLRYMMEIGGKRIRPRLCLSTYSLYNDSFSDEILYPAAALEVFHSFTLIHDDIMDKAPVRRGVPTVYKKWNENTAILSGDSMLVMAYQLVAQCPEHCLKHVMDLFTDTALEIGEGQQYDVDFENRMDVRPEEYIEMIRLKTSVLLACALKLGAIQAGAPQADADLLYKFGESIGLAFQLQDDWLDVYGDPKVFGKNIGGDIVCNKKTYMLITALNQADDKYKEKMKNQDLVLSTNKKLTDPFTVLILGVDSIKDGLDANTVFNGDTMMLVTFNPSTLNTTMLSIPRDSYVPIACFPGKYENKITHSASRGTNCVINTIQDFLDIKIDIVSKNEKDSCFRCRRKRCRCSRSGQEKRF